MNDMTTPDVANNEENVEQPVAEDNAEAENSAEIAAEQTVEIPVQQDGDEKKAKPKRKSAPRKAAGTKTLVVLRDGRVQYADTETVVVIDLDEAASPDTDVHDVLDRLTELRDAAESPVKAETVKALADLIQEKALG